MDKDFNYLASLKTLEIEVKFKPVTKLKLCHFSFCGPFLFCQYCSLSPDHLSSGIGDRPPNRTLFLISVSNIFFRVAKENS